MKLILATVMLMLCLTSCNDDLSREVAQKQISDCFKSDCSNQKSKCTFNLRKHWISDYESSGNFCSVIMTTTPYGEEAELINLFIQNNLIELEREIIYKDCAQWTVNRVKISAENKIYVADETDDYFTLISTEYDVDKVTGIIREKDASQALVEYKIKNLNVSPFGKFLERDCLNIEQDYHANFMKYDDGWRLKN